MPASPRTSEPVSFVFYLHRHLNRQHEISHRYGSRQWVGLFLGPAILATVLLLPVPDGMEPPAWRTAAVGLLMATWWITESIPIPATSLLPLVLFPLLGIAPIGDAAAPFANPLIFLFMGGFIIAIAMQTWNLHRRIALRIVSLVGTKPSSIILGFMIASAFLSMWVSNTATTLMMLPIGLSVVEIARERVSGADRALQRNFSIVLVLSIAYACNVGGMGTIIGTPPNALLVGFLSESYDVEIGFAEWMLVGVPLVVIAVPTVYFVLTKLSFPLRLTNLPGGRAIIDAEIAKLGAMTGAEKKVAVVFGLTALLWISREWLQEVVPGLNDTTIAMAGALACFLIPVDARRGVFLLSWQQAKVLPWGILVLFGGGLSLAAAITATGLAGWIGESVTGLAALPTLLLLVVVIGMVIMLTEITSNTATAAAFLPILASVAVGIGQDPLLFTIPAALAASCAFMLPVATPPNAIVYGSGLFSIPEMARAGIWLNLSFVIILTAVAYFLVGLVFGAGAMVA